MNKFVSAIALSSLLSGTALANHHNHWGYSGENGPENWGTLSQDYHICAEGKNQSPIDLTGSIESALPPIQFNYTSMASEILNNGHTVQANFEPGSTITVDGQAFELKQFHFHSPSENHIDGNSFPMEAHFVHADESGNLAVVAVMLSEGEENPAIAKLWEQMPKQAGDKHPMASKVNAMELLPNNRFYYRFNGSLTTPPCSEGVRWMVMKSAVEISAEQVEAFTHVMLHPNNRPIQATNARPVLK